MKSLLNVVLFLHVTLVLINGTPTRDHKKLSSRMNKALDMASSPNFLEYAKNLENNDKRNLEEPVVHNVRNIQKPRDFTPTVYSNALSLYYLGWNADENVVLGLDTNNVLFRSEDHMMTWSRPTGLESASIYEIDFSPADSSVMFAIGNGTMGYSTTNAGTSWTGYKMSIYPIHVRLHPHLSTWALAISVYGDLYYTSDLGRNWILLKTQVVDFAWCNPGKGGDQSTKVCLISGQGSNGANGGSQAVFMTTDDLGENLNVILNVKADYMIEHPRYLFVIADSLVGDFKNLYVSTDNGTTLQEAILPNGYNIPSLEPAQLLDDSANAIWIGINHGDQDSGIHAGTLYVADSTGYRFTQVLDHVTEISNWWDFDIVRSLEGTYLANVLLSWPQDEPDSSEVVDFQSQTWITYDNGDHWKTLKPPAVDANGEQYNCTASSCTLNLFGRTTWLGIGGGGYFADFWSSETSVGLIMGTGNVGPYVISDADAVATYLSEDGGFHWSEVAKGSMVYEFGDHGGIIVMVPNQVLTKTVFYSLDFGASWIPYQFTTTNVVVTTIFTASAKHSRFVIFGARNGKRHFFGLDFSDAFDSVCTDDQYEAWVLQSEADQDCLLGHETVYYRRKADALCDNPDDFNPIYHQENCNCTADDYECDWGYEPTVSGRQCVPIDPNYVPEINCFPNNTYWQGKGFRLIPGDTCENPISKYSPSLAPCTYNGQNGETTSSGVVLGGGSRKMPSGIIFAIVALVLLLLGFAVFAGIMIGRKYGAAGFLKKFNWKKDNKHYEVGYSNQLQTEDIDED